MKKKMCNKIISGVLTFSFLLTNSAYPQIQRLRAKPPQKATLRTLSVGERDLTLGEFDRLQSGRVLSTGPKTDFSSLGPKDTVGLILAAGEGRRMTTAKMAEWESLWQETYRHPDDEADTPKVVLDIGGRPCARLIADCARQAGVVKTICVVGYRKDIVIKKVGEDEDIVFVEQPTTIGGTADAAMKARWLNGLEDSEATLLIVNGDRPTDPALLERLIEEHRTKNADITLLTGDGDTYTKKGRVVRDGAGEVYKIIEHKDIQSMQGDLVLPDGTRYTRQQLDNPGLSRDRGYVYEYNSATYAIKAKTLFRLLGQLRRTNAQGQYYFTDIVEMIRQEGGMVHSIRLASSDDIIDLTTPRDLITARKKAQAWRAWSRGFKPGREQRSADARAHEYIAEAFVKGRAFAIAGHGKQNITAMVDNYQKLSAVGLTREEKEALVKRLESAARYITEVIQQNVQLPESKIRLTEKTRIVIVLDEEGKPFLYDEGISGTDAHKYLVAFGGGHAYRGSEKLEDPRSIYLSLAQVEGLAREGAEGQEALGIKLEHEDKDLNRGFHTDEPPDRAAKVDNAIARVNKRYALARFENDFKSVRDILGDGKNITDEQYRRYLGDLGALLDKLVDLLVIDRQQSADFKNRIRGLFHLEFYQDYQIRDTMRRIIEELARLSEGKSEDKDALEAIAMMNELLEIAFFFNVFRPLNMPQGDGFWKALETFFATTLESSEEITISMLSKKSPDFKKAYLNAGNDLFRRRHSWLDRCARTLAVKQTGISERMLEDLSRIGTEGTSQGETEALRYFRLWEMARMVKNGFGIPKRVSFNFDSKGTFFKAKGVVAVLYKWGHTQMCFVEGDGRKHRDRAVTMLVPDTYGSVEVVQDPYSGQKILRAKCGLFYGSDGQLTLARFNEPVRIDAAVLPGKHTLAELAESARIPLPWSRVGASKTGQHISYTKRIYTEIFKGTGVYYPEAAYLDKMSAETLALSGPQEAKARASDLERIAALLRKEFAEKGVRKIIVKPDTGSGGRGAETFAILSDNGALNSEVFGEAVEYIYEMSRDDAPIIQKYIRGPPLTQVATDKFVEQAREKLRKKREEDGRSDEYNPGAELRWTLRTIATKTPSGDVVKVKVILVNDKDVVSIDQGAVAFILDDDIFDRKKLQANGLNIPANLSELLERQSSAVVNAVNAYAHANFAQDYPADKEPLDGGSYLDTDNQLLDWAWDPESNRLAHIEFNIGLGTFYFHRNALQQVNKHPWEAIDPFLDNLVERANRYAQALDEKARSRYAYDAPKVREIVTRYGTENLGTKAAQDELYGVIEKSDVSAEDQNVLTRARQAHEQGREVISIVGGLGFAGIGLSTLFSDAKALTDLKDLREIAEKVCSSKKYFEDAKAADVVKYIDRLRWLLNTESVKRAKLLAEIKFFEKAILKFQQDRIVKLMALLNSGAITPANFRKSINAVNEVVGDILVNLQELRSAADKARSENLYTVFSIQRSSPSSGPKIVQVNEGIFPLGGETDGLDVIMKRGYEAGTLWATPSRASIEEADCIISTLRLDIVRLGEVAPDEGLYGPEFKEILDEIHEVAPYLAKNIARRKTQGMPMPTFMILTTQAPGVCSFILRRTIEEELQNLGYDYKAGRDFHFAFTPSRVTPGDNWQRSINQMPQLVGGVNMEDSKAARGFYEGIIMDEVHLYGTPDATELHKTYENTWRDLVIAAANALALYSDFVSGASVWEINAEIAKRPTHKPLQPGFVAGYCLYKDPWFLEWASRELKKIKQQEAAAGKPINTRDKIILQAIVDVTQLFREERDINRFMAYYAAGLVMHALEKAGIEKKDSRVLISGIRYLDVPINDTRNSGAFDIIAGLIGWHGNLVELPTWAQKAIRDNITETLGVDNVTMFDPYVQDWREMTETAEKKIKKGQAPQTSKAIWEQLRRKGTNFIEVSESEVERSEDKPKIIARKAREKAWEVVKDQDALVFVLKGSVEHEELVSDLPRLRRTMRNPVIVDLRNVLDDAKVKEWFALGGIYIGMGKNEEYIERLREDMEFRAEKAGFIFEGIQQGVAKAILQDALDALTDGTDYANMPLDELNYARWLELGGKFYRLKKEGDIKDEMKAAEISRALGRLKDLQGAQAMITGARVPTMAALNAFRQWRKVPELRAQLEQWYMTTDEAELDAQAQRYSKTITQAMERGFASKDGEIIIIRVPGKVKTIGNACDYAKGFFDSAAMATEEDNIFIMSPRDDDLINLGTINTQRFPNKQYLLGDKDFGVPPPEAESFKDQATWDNWIQKPENKPLWPMKGKAKDSYWFSMPWAATAWVRGAQPQMRAGFKGYNLFVGDSTVSSAGGLSSSSNIFVGTILGLNYLYNLNWTLEQLATAGYAERFACGTQGGIADHAALLMCRTGQMGRLSLSPKTTITGQARLPAELHMFIFDSGLNREVITPFVSRTIAEYAASNDPDILFKISTGQMRAMGNLGALLGFIYFKDALKDRGVQFNQLGDIIAEGAASAASIPNGITEGEVRKVLLSIPERISREDLFAKLEAIRQDLAKQPEAAKELIGLIDKVKADIDTKIIKYPADGLPLRGLVAYFISGAAKVSEFFKATEAGDIQRVIEVVKAYQDGERLVEFDTDLGTATVFDGTPSDEDINKLPLWQIAGIRYRSVGPIDWLVDIVEADTQGRVALKILGAGQGGQMIAYVPEASIDAFKQSILKNMKAMIAVKVFGELVKRGFLDQVTGYTAKKPDGSEEYVKGLIEMVIKDKAVAERLKSLVDTYKKNPGSSVLTEAIEMFRENFTPVIEERSIAGQGATVVSIPHTAPTRETALLPQAKVLTDMLPKEALLASV